jgi:hypothetical protein
LHLPEVRVTRDSDEMAQENEQQRLASISG